MSKKLYRVRRYVTLAGDCYVRAENADLAEEIADSEDIECDDFVDDTFDVMEVEDDGHIDEARIYKEEEDD